ncbi:MAG: hypothetical protein U5K72_20295 [Balneolaceae bacterium]|nr:hypothetical protein [Balneolaceae bacterium]
MQKKPIPFHISNVNHGFAEAQGLIHIKKNKLVLEFEIKDAFGGFIKSDLKEIDIPFDEIESLTYKKGLWGASVKIEGSSMRTFEQLPESEQGRCELKIKRKHRDQAEQSISSARVALSEYKLDKLDE